MDDGDLSKMRDSLIEAQYRLDDFINELEGELKEWNGNAETRAA
jgi:hypothetical protein